MTVQVLGTAAQILGAGTKTKQERTYYIPALRTGARSSDDEAEGEALSPKAISLQF